MLVGRPEAPTGQSMSIKAAAANVSSHGVDRGNLPLPLFRRSLMTRPFAPAPSAHLIRCALRRSGLFGRCRGASSAPPYAKFSWLFLLLLASAFNDLNAPSVDLAQRAGRAFTARGGQLGDHRHDERARNGPLAL